MCAAALLSPKITPLIKMKLEINLLIMCTDHFCNFECKIVIKEEK